jgi:hypothetical protein
MSLAKAFDKKASYGQVFGAPGVAYDQNGQFYNYDFLPVDLAGNLLKAAPAPTPAAPVKAAAPVVPSVTDDPDADTPEDEKPIDLVAWANGSLPGLRFFNVKSAVKAAYGKTPNTADEARAIVLGQ